MSGDTGSRRLCAFDFAGVLLRSGDIIMEKVVSTTTASRSFSSILRDVLNGRSYVVTRHGIPVARVIPVERTGDMMARAKDILLSRLKQQSLAHIDHWSRDELYGDETTAPRK
jgi:prevent-host-death family protein